MEHNFVIFTLVTLAGSHPSVPSSCLRQIPWEFLHADTVCSLDGDAEENRIEITMILNKTVLS